MSLYQKASLVQIPSGYKASSANLYSVVPNNGDGDFTISADADATRINKDGLIESVVADQARLNYNFIDGVVQPDPYLLLEPESANLLQRSEDYANAYWLKSRVGSSATGFTAPDGSSNATYFEQQSGQTTAAVIYKSSFTSVSSGVYTFSIWAKQEDKRYIKLQTRANSATYRTVFDLQDGVITYDSGNENAKIEAYPNGWYRLSLQRTSTTTDDVIVYYYLNDSAGASDTVTDSGGVYIWGSQVEKKDYLTSYIPTSGSILTRTQDRCFNGGDANLFNDSEGVLFADLEALGEGTTIRKISLSNGNTSFVNFNFNATSGRVDFEFGSTLNSFYIVNSTGHTLTNRNKIAIKYKSGDTDCFINGTRVTGSVGTFSLSGLDRVNFENRGTSGSQNMFAKIHQLMVFNEALTDAELTTLTS